MNPRESQPLSGLVLEGENMIELNDKVAKLWDQYLAAVDSQTGEIETPEKKAALVKQAADNFAQGFLQLHSSEDLEAMKRDGFVIHGVPGTIKLPIFVLGSFSEITSKQAQAEQLNTTFNEYLRITGQTIKEFNDASFEKQEQMITAAMANAKFSVSEEALKLWGNRVQIKLNDAQIKNTLVQIEKTKLEIGGLGLKVFNDLADAGFKTDATSIAAAASNGQLDKFLHDKQYTRPELDGFWASIKSRLDTEQQAGTVKAIIDKAIQDAKKAEQEKIEMTQRAAAAVVDLGPALQLVGIGGPGQPSLEQAMGPNGEGAGRIVAALGKLKDVKTPDGKHTYGESAIWQGLQKSWKDYADNFKTAKTLAADVRKANADAITAEQNAEQSVMTTAIMHSVMPMVNALTGGGGNVAKTMHAAMMNSWDAGAVVGRGTLKIANAVAPATNQRVVPRPAGPEGPVTSN